METGSAVFAIDYSISLDTQAFSYLEPFLSGIERRLPPDFREVFRFISRQDVNVDPIPYMVENLQHITNEHSAWRIFTKFKAYEVLRTIDTIWLEKRSEIRSQLDDPELSMRAQHHMSRILYHTTDNALMREYKNRYRWFYILLLEMAIIRFEDAKLALKQKLNKFVNFCNQKLSTIFARECVIAWHYFQRGQDLRFFRKVQVNSKNLFAVLRGMAWDLLHVRHLEQALTFRTKAEPRYFFSALLTFDKGLCEVMDMYPLKACACALIDGQPTPIAFPQRDWFTLVTDEPAEQERIRDRFYSNEARMSRNERRDEAKFRLAEIVSSLEAELSHVAKVPRPATEC